MMLPSTICAFTQSNAYKYIDTVYLMGNSDEPNSLMRLGILFLLLRSKKRGMGGSGRNLLKDIGDDRIKVSIVGCPVGS